MCACVYMYMPVHEPVHECMHVDVPADTWIDACQPGTAERYLTDLVGIKHELGPLGHVSNDNHDALDSRAGVHDLRVAE